ncbi:hypothetical protein ACH6EH_02660 [Paenibacillus sp. JSM ZJ436]|uniref:hypothetical protein n=1 Tax=Paenibacillus sp. JSM ZJ436 TaxID=3376190 RepID=UPI00379C6607
MECIVHFTVVQKDGPKKLRGLIFVEQGERPTGEDLIGMFANMDLHVVPDPDDSQRFLPAGLDPDFRYIRVNELDLGEEKHQEDHNLKSILNELLSPKRAGF